MEEKENKTKRDNKLTGPLNRLLKNDRFLSLIVMVGLVGICLIFISSSFSGAGGKGETETVKEEKPSSVDDIEAYREQLSQELGNMLASMEGVGKTKLMITIEGTSRSIYATDVDLNDKQTSRKSSGDENADSQNTERRSCIIIKGKDGAEKALTVGQLMPQIKGVLVVCQGADNETTRESIIRAVAAALNINRSHICVSKLGT